MSFFAELKRRNVGRVGIAYVVASWLVAQVTELAADSFGAPEWVMKMLLIVLAAGLPVALILAWALELTPEGIKREKDVDRSKSITPQTGKKLNNTILVLMTLAIAYLLIDKFSGSAQPGSEPFSQQTSNQTTKPDEKRALTPVEAELTISKQSIAVLPFDNRSNLKEDEYFVEGIHDDLLTNLAKIGSLKVISRTSVARYKDTQASIPEIAKELDVATIMEGAVQRAGEKVRINVQLIDAKTDEHIWAEIFDRELTTENLFAIQSEISEKIATALKATLSPEEQKRVNDRPTENLAAYSAYLRGKQLATQQTAETADQALLEFQRATELDPQFALAWVGVAEAAQLAFRFSDMKAREERELLQLAVDKALAIDDQLGEAHLARAYLLRLGRAEPEEIEAAYQLAVKLSPGYARAWERYSDFLDKFPNRLPEALEKAKKAADLDPLSPVMQNQVIYVLKRMQQFGEAQFLLEQLIEQDPGFAPSYQQMSDLKYDTGQFDQSIIWAHKARSLDPGNILYVMFEMWPQLHIGNTQGLEQLLNHMEVVDPNGSTLSFMDMWVNIYKQNYDAALEAANLFYQRRGGQPAGKGPQIIIHSLRNDPVTARQIGEVVIPIYFDRKTWAKALEVRSEMGCTAAWSLMGTGEPEMGRDLSLLTIEYLQNQPGSQSGISQLALCYMNLDRPDEVLKIIEESAESGMIQNWWLAFRHPVFQLLRHDPRFVAAEAKIQANISAQRENLARLQEGDEQ